MASDLSLLGAGNSGAAPGPNLNAQPDALDVSDGAHVSALTGSLLAGNVTVTAPSGFEVSKDGSSYAASQTVAPSSGNVAQTIYTRRTAAGERADATGSVRFSSAGAASVYVAVAYVAARYLVADPTSLDVTDGPESFVLDWSPAGAWSDVEVIAPGTFEVSDDEAGEYGGSLTVAAVDFPFTVWARRKPPGSTDASGNLSCIPTDGAFPLLGVPIEYTAAFDPLTLPNLVLWLDANDAATLFQDSARTTPATADGDPVGGWADKSGAGNHATQATGALRPALALAAQNGKAVVRTTDANDHKMMHLPFGMHAGGAFTVFAVWNETLGQTSKVMLGVRDASGSPTYDFNMLRPDMYYRDDGSDKRISRSPPVGATFTQTTVIEKADRTAVLRDDGSVVGTAAAASAYPTRNLALWTQDGSDGANSYIAGGLAELLVMNGEASAGNITAAAAYLKAKWGTP